MAKKTKIEEKAELNEKGAFQPEPVQPPAGPDASAAAATLHPHSNDVADPKSKFEYMAAMLGQFAQIDTSKEDWENNAQSVIASLCGNGGGVDGGASAHNKDTIKMKASAALGSAMKEALESIFDGTEGLSEDFRNKTSTLFEAAIEARMIIERESFNEEVQKLEEQHSAQLVEEVNQITEELTEAVGEYADYAAQEWMTENEVAIESSLRNEIANDLLEGLRNVFLQNNINVPEEHVEVVDAMSEKIDELEKRLASAISENADLKRDVEAASKKEITDKVTEGLTLVQAEKLKELSENLDYDSIEDFETKLKTIKESNFLKAPKKSMITEALQEVISKEVEDEPATPKQYSSPDMRVYAEAIARQVRRTNGVIDDGKSN